LAEALYRQGRFGEAEEWVGVGETHSAVDDLDARLLWLPVRAKIAAQRGEFEEAIALLSDAATLAETTDGLNRRAAVQMDLGEVLRLARRVTEATVAFGQAIDLFAEKGNLVAAARVRSLQDDLALV
jgi:Flp pilus assembly protein TadD